MEVRERIGRFIECCDCGDAFPYSPGEQKYYEDHGLADPKRCPACRKWKKLNNKYLETMSREDK